VDPVDERLSVGLLEAQHVGLEPADARGERSGREGGHVDGVGVERAELARQPQDVAARHLLVDLHVLDADADELVDLEWVAGGEGLLEHAPDEVLLALDATQVAGGVALPAATYEFFEVAAPRPGQRLEPVEVGTARGLDVQSTDLV